MYRHNSNIPTVFKQQNKTLFLPRSLRAQEAIMKTLNFTGFDATPHSVPVYASQT